MNWYRIPKPQWATKLPAWVWPIVLAAASVLTMLGLCPGPQSPTPNVPPEPPLPPPAFGWVADPEAVAKVVAGLPQRSFRETPAYQQPVAGPEDVFLWDACRTVTGELLPARDQGSVGSCVAFGTVAAIEHLQCVQIARLRGDGLPSPRYRDLSTEVVYAGSRVEIGGGQLTGDGSIGAWAARWVQEFGVVPRDRFGDLDLTAYREDRCRLWGRQGVPEPLKAQARLHPVQTVIPVKSWAECRQAIRNGYPIAICSMQGFSAQRDAQGFAKPQGTWPHCMALVGVRADRPGGFILNSWGERYHRGPLGAGNPSPAGFWADAEIIDKMLRQGDSWAFSDVVGFPARQLDWITRRSPNRHPNDHSQLVLVSKKGSNLEIPQ
ncbi:C1 family peptidase [Tuwongella immobilis]|uniref:Peptidase C1A papain C-terminal domain-containing protein n=1 Tax=Tuwongella immobilis TaxID=692036 RepID=A0A6C2YI42_9BACT|nr:hypothetical protein [Tuwongella immobilis]VIP01200.1 Uncharacterized protein OS=Isosphaera pallida (strain ATCC 43644 / DSM 9630 / IS1B) GN=Isop_1985 PE=4 SV=1 [Tuwongella immobilis]VTR97826.1 Uncharacterized protein OS=Isosphaera pallida (strain ATCC 43644 / DSM 9630 / IS1B) GN=Isop_1985 PE=4 SV=1 [Tuwongella immobilis]